jgi:molybdenum cofactor cytidylyltransferase
MHPATCTPAVPVELQMGGEIVGILLAAGRGSRFGSDKLMHPLTDGRPMAEIAARRLLPACDRVIAVCRPGSEALARQLADCGCRILPCSEAATHQRVSDELRSGAGIVTVEYEGRRGHPVGFAQAYFPELIALSGDQGARRLLVTHAARIKCLALGDPGICRDIDTVADLVA